MIQKQEIGPLNFEKREDFIKLAEQLAWNLQKSVNLLNMLVLRDDGKCNFCGEYKIHESDCIFIKQFDEAHDLLEKMGIQFRSIARD